MKRILSLIVFIFCFNLFCFSQETEENFWKSITPDNGKFSTQFRENYLGLRISRNIYDDWMNWSSLDVSWDEGLFLGIWNTAGLENAASTGGNELDITAGWKFSKVTEWDLDVTISATYFNLNKVGDWRGSDVWVQSLQISKSFQLSDDHSLQAQVWLEWISEVNDFRGGALVNLSNVNHHWDKMFGVGWLSFNQNFMFPWDDGFKKAGNSSDGLFLRYTPSINFEVTRNLSIFGGVTILTPINSPGDGRDDTEISPFFGATLSFAF